MNLFAECIENSIATFCLVGAGKYHDKVVTANMPNKIFRSINFLAQYVGNEFGDFPPPHNHRHRYMV